MASRKEYKHQWYLDNKEKQLKKQKKYYREHKEERLTYQQNYDILNREDILAKNKVKSLAFRGHAHSIWAAIKKYAHKWNLPICTFEEFYDNWTADDSGYQELYDTWVASEYNELCSPVVMRQVKKNGFVPGNLKWDVKQNYSWWGEDAIIFKKSEKKLEEKQKVYNRRNKEWRKKVRDQWKAQQKAKRVT